MPRWTVLRPRTPVEVGATVLVVAALLVLARWLGVLDGDLSRFVLVGTNHADPALVPRGVHVMTGEGYDGQYYFRFALDPGHLDGTVGGVRVDLALRRNRIGYPLLAWLLSYGHPAAVVVALVVVNVLALAVLGTLGAVLARDAGRAPAWGLLLPAWCGLVQSLARDLTEPVAAATVLGGLVALQRRRPGLAAAAFALAVVTRETTVVVVFAYGACRLLRLVRRRARPGADDLAWTVPAAVFVAWQAYVGLAYGEVPVLREGGNGSPPGVAVARGLARWVTDPDRDRVLSAVGVLVAAALVGLVLRAARRGGVPGWWVAAVVLLALLAVSLSSDVWNGDSYELRVLVERHVVGAAVLLRSPGRAAGAYAALTGALVVWAGWFALAYP